MTTSKKARDDAERIRSEMERSDRWGAQLSRQWEDFAVKQGTALMDMVKKKAETKNPSARLAKEIAAVNAALAGKTTDEVMAALAPKKRKPAKRKKSRKP